MEIFLLAALAAFLLTSAAWCHDQPANVRTWACAGYVAAGLLLLGLLTVVILDVDNSAWRSDAGRIAGRLVGKTALASALGVLTGVTLLRAFDGPHLILQLFRCDIAIVVLCVVGIPAWAWTEPGAAWPYLVAFILAAIAGMLATAAFGAPNQPAHLATAAGVLYLVSIVALIALILIVLGRTGGLGYTAEYLSHRLSGRELVELILGGAFGWMARTWWVRTPYHHGAPGLAWAAGALVGLPVLALLAAYGPVLLASISTLKTSFAEFQFVPARIGDRAAFEVERDRAIDNLAFLLAYESKPKMDINYLKLRQALGEPGLGRRLLGAAATADLFRDALAPIVKCIRVARTQTAHPPGLQDVLRPVAHQLTRLLEVAKGDPKFVAGVKTALGDRLTETYIHLATVVADPNPENCPGPRLDKKWPDKQWPQMIQATRLTEGTPAYLLLAVLHFSVGNVEKALAILKEGVDRFPDDAPLAFQYAIFAYFGERDYEEILKHTDLSLRLLDQAAEKVRQGELKKPLPGLTDAVLQGMKRRYEDGRLVLTNFLAYVSAQAGVREEASIDLAETNYKLLRGPRTDPLGEPGFRVTLIDTFGYVLMASGARRVPPDMDRLRRAKALFEDAKSEAAGLSASEKRQVIAVIESHARQAAKFLPR